MDYFNMFMGAVGVVTFLYCSFVMMYTHVDKTGSLRDRLTMFLAAWLGATVSLFSFMCSIRALL